MNLLQTIQQNRQTLAQPQGVTDQTQQVQGLMAAKSGKAAAAPDTGISNLGEQSAVATTNQQLGQQQVLNTAQSQAENTAAAGIDQNTAIQKTNIAQQNAFNTVQNRVQTNAILNSLAQDKGNIQTQQKQAALEQVSFNLSMQDKQYTDTIQNIGARRRLDNDVNFKSEQQQIAFGNSLSILQQKLGESDVLAASDRDFQKALSNLSIQDAMKIAQIQAAGAQSSFDVNASIASQQANAEQTQANKKSEYGAAASVIGAGAQAYGDEQTGKFDQDYLDAQGSGYKGTYSQWQALQALKTPIQNNGNNGDFSSGNSGSTV